MDHSDAQSATLTNAIAAATASSVATSHMSMNSGNGCKISMLLNWHTVDSCFLTPSFHVRTSAGFFAVCISSFLLVICLELLRRLQRRLDMYFRLQHARRSSDVVFKEFNEFDDQEMLVGHENVRTVGPQMRRAKDNFQWDWNVLLEQSIRGLVHMVQFAASYVVMLLVMYTNGYVIISILLGALVGFALFTRDMIVGHGGGGGGGGGR